MSRKIAFAGIFTGVSVMLLYMSAVMPTGKLTLYFLASLPVALAMIEFGAGTGISVYFATCILSVLIAGNIYGIVPFALFFGHYPVFKFYIEKRRKAMVEVLLKLAVLNISALLWYLLFKNIFIKVLPVQFTDNSWLLLIFAAALQVVFFAYDYVFSRLLSYYESKLSIIKRG
ncbi:MAG: hypothetical protein APF77_16845 [Clostridia bacterium BRH_c25]|nr:MAG: hypothetical protein APF77_16845 [Clostridia bacterium BRH_c25]